MRRSPILNHASGAGLPGDVTFSGFTLMARTRRDLWGPELIQRKKGILLVHQLNPSGGIKAWHNSNGAIVGGDRTDRDDLLAEGRLIGEIWHCINKLGDLDEDISISWVEGQVKRFVQDNIQAAHRYLRDPKARSLLGGLL